MIFVQTHCFVHKWKHFVTLMSFISLKFAFRIGSENAVAPSMKY